MKPLVYSIAILCIFLATSCKVIKNWKNTTVERYYHDTTIVETKETIKPVFIPADSTKAVFNLKKLLESGELTSHDRNYITRIVYRDGNLNVTTQMDSIMLLLREYETTLKAMKHSEEKTAITEQTKTKTKPFNWALLGLFIALVILGLIVLFSKFKPRIL